jgi:hypothetical protein
MAIHFAAGQPIFLAGFCKITVLFGRVISRIMLACLLPVNSWFLFVIFLVDS